MTIDHRPGMLASLSETLGDAGVNIEALAGFGSDGEGKVHLIVDDEATARAVLRRANISFIEKDIITTLLPHKPGALASVTRELADAGVNIDAVYMLRSRPEGLEFAFSVDVLDIAEQRLAV